MDGAIGIDIIGEFLESASRPFRQERYSPLIRQEKIDHDSNAFILPSIVDPPKRTPSPRSRVAALRIIQSAGQRVKVLRANVHSLWRRVMPNTLGLDDDLDGVEVVREIERVFDVKVSNEEAERIFTIGEFHDLLLSKLPPNEGDRKCATAMTFYRIRSALRRLGYGDELTPASDMRVLERGRAKTNLRKLGVESGLHMPGTVSTRIGRRVAFCGFVVTLATVFSLQPGFASALLGIMIGLIIVGAILKYGDPGKLPANCNTLADLTRTAAAMNYGRLVKMGARHRDEDIWDNLVEALSHYALPKPDITRETFFLQSQLKKRSTA